MKKFIFTIAVYLIVNISFTSEYCEAQWEPDVRLTNASGTSSISYNNTWSIATNGNIVHIVWSDERDGNREIYYKRSTDTGTTWGTDTRLTNYAAESMHPSIGVSGSIVHIVWFDYRDGNYEIYYKRSSDGGINWGADTRLTNNTAYSIYPSLAVSNTFVHIVWNDQRDGTWEIYYKSSTDGGINWGADTRLTNNSTNSYYPSIAVTGSLLHVVWQDSRDGNNEIYYKPSTNGGTTWGTDTRLTNNASNSRYPSIAVYGTLVNVVWEDNRDGNYEIYYKRSPNSGIIWETDTRLTDNSAWSLFPSIAASGSFVHIVWVDDRDGNYEIYYKNSLNSGINWEADTRLTNNSAGSWNPSILASSTNVHIVWNDSRHGDDEVYYKRNQMIPSAPVLYSPANNSVGQSTNLNLVWNKPQYSTKYRVLLATDSLFTNVIVNDSLLTDSVKSLSNLNPLTNYWWKVNAGNGNPTGWSSYSTVFKFRTISKPSQVTLNLPSNNSVNQPVNITFKWLKAFDQTVKTKAISNYWLEYSADSNFISGVVKDSLLTDSLKSVSGLNTATKYYWRVKAKNIAGWGVFSNAWNFTTVPPLPVAPVLVSPVNGATNLAPNVLLDWNAVQYAAGYRVQIANDSLFTSIVKDTSSVVQDTLRIRSGILLANTKYFWRVNATNISGTGQWSTVWNFRINPTGLNQIGNEIPTTYSVEQNYPNPFNPMTKIKFQVPSQKFIKLVVFDILGKEVETLVNEQLQPGTYEVTFDAGNLNSGIYFYRLIANEIQFTKKCILLK